MYIRYVCMCVRARACVHVAVVSMGRDGLVVGAKPVWRPCFAGVARISRRITCPVVYA